MREIRLSGSEGGVGRKPYPYPYFPPRPAGTGKPQLCSLRCLLFKRPKENGVKPPQSGTYRTIAIKIEVEKSSRQVSVEATPGV